MTKREWLEEAQGVLSEGNKRKQLTKVKALIVKNPNHSRYFLFQMVKYRNLIQQYLDGNDGLQEIYHVRTTELQDDHSRLMAELEKEEVAAFSKWLDNWLLEVETFNLAAGTKTEVFFLKRDIQEKRIQTRRHLDRLMEDHLESVDKQKEDLQTIFDAALCAIAV